MLDGCGMGELSVDLIEEALPKYNIGVPPGIDDIFKGVDLNQDSYITYGDFLAATLPHSLRCKEDLCRMVFSRLDQNRDGFIDSDDLVTVFLSDKSGEKSDERNLELCREALAEVASCDEVDRIDFAKFFDLMKGGHASAGSNGIDAVVTPIYNGSRLPSNAAS